ncbi:hypothetical protein ABVK25_010805 [Lepraria finkii]|uniref:Uncharacterized protein n=1 Tax=Lepraria finkii TaxID=1340010 RepID=A0ABR4ATC1_9LECA
MDERQQRQRRQNNGSYGSEQDYIIQLQLRLKLLEDHHRGCNLNTSKSIFQSPPASPDVSGEESESDTESVPAENSHPATVSNKPILQFIQYELPAADAVRRPIRPRWMQEADILLAEIPVATEWVKTWEDCGISSRHHNHNAIATVLGTPTTPDNRAGNLSSAFTTLDCQGRNFRENLITYATRYGEIVRSSEATAKLATNMAAFQQLVFVSLCVILEDRGIDTSIVDGIMRTCISDSSSKNLRRLRSGALWVNKAITELQWRGWNQRASEIFILLGRGIAQYARFGDSPEQSRLYFTRRLTDDKYIKGLAAPSDWISFSIPIFVKRLTGDLLKDSEIFESLGYSVVPKSAGKRMKKPSEPGQRTSEPGQRTSKRRRECPHNGTLIPPPVPPTSVATQATSEETLYHPPEQSQQSSASRIPSSQLLTQTNPPQSFGHSVGSGGCDGTNTNSTTGMAMDGTAHQYSSQLEIPPISREGERYPQSTNVPAVRLYDLGSGAGPTANAGSYIPGLNYGAEPTADAGSYIAWFPPEASGLNYGARPTADAGSYTPGFSAIDNTPEAEAPGLDYDAEPTADAGSYIAWFPPEASGLNYGARPTADAGSYTPGFSAIDNTPEAEAPGLDYDAGPTADAGSYIAWFPPEASGLNYGARPTADAGSYTPGFSAIDNTPEAEAPGLNYGAGNYVRGLETNI